MNQPQAFAMPPPPPAGNQSQGGVQHQSSNPNNPFTAAAAEPTSGGEPALLTDCGGGHVSRKVAIWLVTVFRGLRLAGVEWFFDRLQQALTVSKCGEMSGVWWSGFP